MRRSLPHSTWLVLLAILVAGTAGATTVFHGSTTGVFSPTISGLSFTGTTFDFSDTPPGGLVSLGTFTWAPSPSCGYCAYSPDMTLTISFTLPSLASLQFDGAVDLYRPQVTLPMGGTRAGAEAQVTFGPLQTVNFTDAGGSGSFAIQVQALRIGVSNGPSTSGQIYGQISNFVYTPNGSSEAAVPEPSPLELTGGAIGFLGLARFLRGRRRSPAGLAL